MTWPFRVAFALLCFFEYLPWSPWLSEDLRFCDVFGFEAIACHTRKLSRR